MVGNLSPVRGAASAWMCVAAAMVVAGCGSSTADGTDGGAGTIDAPGGGTIDAPRPIDAPGGPTIDAGPSPTGDPATGPGGGNNLTCGGSSFPPNATFYQDISSATVDGESATIMAALDARKWGDPADRQTLGIDFSFEVNCAASNVARRAYTGGDNPPDCDLAPVPLPAGGKTEGSGDYACSPGDDCHLIAYQGTRLYELYHANITGGAATGGTFTGECLAIWDLTRDYWDPSNHSPNYSRGDACDGGNAADLPIAPMLLTAEELNAALAGDGMIHHALRFTMKNNRIRASGYVHPATHYGFGGTTGGADTLPTGARLRLRGDYNLASLPNDAARVIARTLQHYGMYLADGGNIFISATTDASDVLNNSAVGALLPSDFQMVGGGRRIGRNDYSCEHVPVTD
jgi:serine/threonine-protein kinase